MDRYIDYIPELHISIKISTFSQLIYFPLRALINAWIDLDQSVGLNSRSSAAVGKDRIFKPRMDDWEGP